MTAKLCNAGILGTGFYVPEKIMTNADLEKIVETSDEWIVERTGIKERRIAEDNQPMSDLALRAAKAALADAGVAAEDLDLIIVATLTSDRIIPSTACMIQNLLGAKHAAAFDLSAAKRLSMPMDKVIVNIHKYGNMSAACIPIALAEAAAAKRFKKGDIIALSGFGAGLTWASCIIRWSKED